MKKITRTAAGPADPTPAIYKYPDNSARRPCSSCRANTSGGFRRPWYPVSPLMPFCFGCFSSRRLPSVPVFASVFASALRDMLGGDLSEVNRRNETAAAGVCHSHDFCDANMAAIDAMAAFGMPWDHEDHRLVELVTSAWDLAMVNKFWPAAAGDPRGGIRPAVDLRAATADEIFGALQTRRIVTRLPDGDVDFFTLGDKGVLYRGGSEGAPIFVFSPVRPGDLPAEDWDGLYGRLQRAFKSCGHAGVTLPAGTVFRWLSELSAISSPHVHWGGSWDEMCAEAMDAAARSAGELGGELGGLLKDYDPEMS